MNGDAAKPFSQARRPRDVDEKHEAAFLDRACGTAR